MAGEGRGRQGGEGRETPDASGASASSSGVRPGGRRRADVALLVCGALAAEVRRIVEERGWDVELYGIPAIHHLRPERIVAAVEERLQELRPLHDQVVVVYGDCGTDGKLDEVLDRHEATRPVGEHCYEIYCGCRFRELAERRPRSYLLTDFMVRNWEGLVLRGMGLDRAPHLARRLFAGFESVTYLRQDRDQGLTREAERIAEELGLPLVVEDTGTEELATRLQELLGEEVTS